MDVLCIGEMLIDFLPGSEPNSYIRNAGGAPANVAIAVAKNGYQSGFVGKMGDDDFGRFLVETLEENGVESLCKELTSEAVTTMAFVTLHADGERFFTFARKPGADMLLSVADIKSDAIEQSTIVHAGSCSLSKSPAAEATEYALQMAREKGKLVSFDVNYRNLLWDDDQSAAADRIYKVLDHIDLLKISEEEVDMLGGEGRMAETMRVHGISLVVETLGAKGAKCFFQDSVLEIPGRKADAVDATGAGDAFWGGFLSSLLAQGVTAKGQLTPERILKAMAYGNVAGWICVQSKGAIASLPTKAQIEQYLDGEFQ